jgi:hypothetical protein
MIDIRKNRLNEIVIEVSKYSPFDNWLSDQDYFTEGTGCWRPFNHEKENTNVYCVSRELFKEFVYWAFQGEQCCERDYDHDGNCDRHREQISLTMGYCPECTSKNVTYTLNGMMKCNTCAKKWYPRHYDDKVCVGNRIDTTQVKTDLKWDEKDDAKLNTLLSSWGNKSIDAKALHDQLSKLCEIDIRDSENQRQKVYKIRNKKTGLFRLPSLGSNVFTKVGKTWSTRGHVSAHMVAYNDHYSKDYDCEVVEYELVEVSRTSVKEWKTKK